MSDYELHLGDCLQVMAGMEADSVDSIVTDPPYGLSFMGKGWDHGVPGIEFWTEALRVAKPGAHLLAFGGDRTHHRLMVAIEDAGWEIRTCIYWIFGSGFPKSLNVGKAIDKAAGAEREVVGFDASKYRRDNNDNNTYAAHCGQTGIITAPATDAARQWDGWGTALKPAAEIIIVARKPFPGTVAQNVLEWGTGAINVDGCRVGTEPGLQRPERRGKGVTGGWAGYKQEPGEYGTPDGQGRWPANVILSYPEDEYDADGNLLPNPGRDEVVGLFPVTTSGGENGVRKRPNSPGWGMNAQTITNGRGPDTGSAARFFYCAKASKADRDEGCEGFDNKQSRTTYDKSVRDRHGNDSGHPRANHHPTVKPTDLMRYLCRLVTPPNGTVLDPFMGSGSTGKAALMEGFRFVGVELDSDYIEIAEARIAKASQMAASEFVAKAGSVADTDELPLFAS